MKKNVLITGASSGIGLAISQKLEKDYNLFLTGRRKSDKLNYFSADLAEYSSNLELYNRAKDYFKADIDILINCAGQYICKSIEKMEQSEVDYLLNLNFKSAYYLTSFVINDMKKNKWGRIVNIGSISATVGEAYATLYSASKAALSGFTKALALEVAADNITINQINPGWVKTPLVDNHLTDNEKQEVIDVTPQNRFIEPKEIADLCAYLISDSAKGLTGQNISLCAGLSIG